MEGFGHDAFDRIEPAEFERRCDSCDANQGGHCHLRGLELTTPERTTCIDHSIDGGRRSKVPLGPVYDVDGGLAVHTPPGRLDGPARNRLLTVLEDLPRDPHLSLEERVALWQARAVPDGRVQIALEDAEDRLECGFCASRDAPGVEAPLDAPRLRRLLRRLVFLGIGIPSC